jgi:hypothetical protein
MKTEWAYPESETFDDVADTISKRRVLFGTFKGRPTFGSFMCRINSPLPSEIISPMELYSKILSADNWPLVTDFDQFDRWLSSFHSLICTETTGKGKPTNNSAFKEGKAYYEKNKDLLVSQYNGKYIAVWNNSVIDHDTSFSTLAERVYNKLGYVSIYMPFVTSKRRVLRLESPRCGRSKANVS